MYKSVFRSNWSKNDAAWGKAADDQRVQFCLRHSAKHVQSNIHFSCKSTTWMHCKLNMFALTLTVHWNTCMKCWTTWYRTRRGEGFIQQAGDRFRTSWFSCCFVWTWRKIFIEFHCHFFVIVKCKLKRLNENSLEKVNKRVNCCWKSVLIILIVIGKGV